MRKKPLCFAMLSVCATSFFLSSCVDNDYDLNKDIDLTIQVGSDAFMIPLGYTEDITLDKMIDTTDVLKLDDNGLYAIKKADDIDDVDVSINDVTIKVDNPTFEGIIVDFEDKKVNDFDVNVPSNETNLGAPKIDVDVTLPTSSSESDKEVIPAGTSADVSIANKTVNVTGDADFNFTYKAPDWPEEVAQIKTVYIGNDDKGQLVTFNVNTSAVMDALKTGATQTITSFVITFPEGVVLAKNDIGRVDGNKFYLENHALSQTQKKITFYVVKQNLTGATREAGIDFKEKITYTLDYVINGQTKSALTEAALIHVDMPEVAFKFRKSDAVTNDVNAEMKKDYFNITADINDLDDIQRVNYVTFKPESKILLNISKLNLPAGLNFKSGNVIVDFPERYTLRKESDNKGGNIIYDANTNKLKIPSQYLSEAQVVFTLERAEMADKYPIVNNSIPLEDKAYYYVEEGNPLILQGDVETDQLVGLENEVMQVNVDAGTMFVLNSNVVADAVTAEVEDKTTLDIDEDVDEALKVLKTVGWKNGVKPHINFVINFEDFPKDIDQLEFKNFNIYLPRFMKFVESDNVTLGEYQGATYGVLPLVGRFNPHEGYKKTLTVDSLDFSYMDNGNGLKTVVKNGRTFLTVDVDKEVKIFGNVQTIAGTTVDTDKLKDIPVKPVVTVEDMPVGKITGTVNPDIDDVNEAIALDLGSDLDFLKEQGTNLDITNPQISLVLSNTMGVPVDMELHMSAKDAVGRVIDGSAVQPVELTLAAAKKDGVPTTTKFLLSRLENTSKPADTEDTVYVTKTVSDLANLMKVVPDSVSFNLTATAHGTSHRIDLSKEMKITGNYDVIVPLEFESIDINYKDTIDNLRSDLKDFSGKIKQAKLKVVGVVANTIPVDLHLNVNPLDVAGNLLDGISAVVTTNNKRTNEKGEEEYIIGACVEENKPTETEIFIDLISEGTDIRQLENLELVIHASATETKNGISLKKMQYVKLSKMFVYLKKANIDLNE